MSKKLFVKLPDNSDKRKEMITKVLRILNDISSKNPFSLFKNIFFNDDKYLKSIGLDKLSGVLIYKVCLDVVDQLYSEKNDDFLYDNYNIFKKKLKDKLEDWILKTHLEIDYTFMNLSSNSDLFNKFKGFINKNYELDLNNLDNKFNDITDLLLKEAVFERVNNYLSRLSLLEDNPNNFLQIKSNDLNIKTSIENSIYNTYLKDIEYKIENGLVNEAKILLDSLKDKMPNDDSLETKNNKYLYYILLSKYYIKKNDFYLVSEYHKKAAKYVNDESKIILNALSYLNEKNFEKVLKLINPLFDNYNLLEFEKRVNIFNIKIATFINSEEIYNFIDFDIFHSDIKNYWQFIYIIGKSFAHLGDFASSQKYLNRVIPKIKEKDENFDLYIEQVKAEIAEIKISEWLNKNISIEDTLDKSIKDDIQYLENLVSKIKIEDRENNSNWLRLIAKIRFQNGNFQDSYKIYDELLSYNSKNLQIIYDKMFLLHKENKHLEVKEIFIDDFFDEVNNIAENAGAISLYIYALYELKEYSEVIKVGKSFLENYDEFDVSKFSIFTNIYNSYNLISKDENRLNDFFIYSKEIMKKSSKLELTVKIFLMTIYKHQKNNEEYNNILSYLKLNLNNIIHSINKPLVNYLADTLYSIEEYELTIILYELTSQENKGLNDFFKLAYSYYYNNNLTKSLKVCRDFRRDYGIHKIIDLEGLIYNKIENLNESKVLYKEYLKKNPNNNNIKIHYAVIIDRLGEKLQDGFLESIDTNDLSYEFGIPNLIFLLIRNKKYKKALKLAYSQMRNNLGSPAHNDFYVRTYLNINSSYINENLNDLPIVSKDTSVIISDSNDNRFTYVIINPEDKLLKEEEISCFDDFAINTLLGKRKNEEFTYKNIKYKVVFINSKYVYEFNRIIKLTGNPKYNSKFLLKRGTGVDSFNKFSKEYSEGRSKYVKETIKTYWMKFMTVNQLGKYLNENNYKTFGHLINDDKFGFLAFPPHNKDEEILENTNKNIVLDIISILSIHLLGLEDYIMSNFNNLFISLSVIDELEEFKASYEGAFYTKDNDFLNNIIEWTRTHCKLSKNGIEKILVLDSEKYQQHIDIFGKSFFNSILLAEQENAVLYSDDLRLRNTVDDIEKIQTENKENQSENRLFDFDIKHIKTTNSLSIINTLYKNKIIDFDKLNEIKVKMVDYRYSFIKGNKDMLIKAAELSNWEPESYYKSSLTLLDGNHYANMFKNPLPYVLDLSVSFMVELLNKPKVDSNKKYLLIFKLLSFLNGTTSNLNISEVLMVKFEEIEESLFFKSELINILIFWSKNKDTEEVNKVKYLDDFNNFLNSKLKISEENLINNIVYTFVNGFNIDSLLESLENDKKLKENKSLYEIIIGFLKNKGDLSSFEKNEYYKKFLDRRLLEIHSGLARNSIFSKITEIESDMGYRLIDWINIELKKDFSKTKEDREIKKYYLMIIDYLKTNNIIEFNKKYSNKELISSKYRNIFNGEFLKISANILSSLVEKTIIYDKLKDETQKNILIEDIKNYINLVSLENSIIEFKEEHLKMLKLLQFILGGNSFRSYKNKTDKLTYSKFYIQYLTLSNKDIIKSFVEEAKKLKNHDEYDDISTFIEVIDLATKNYDVTTNKIFVIIKKYLLDEDIKEYQNDILYGSLIEQLLS